MTNRSYLTAMARKVPSKPAQWLAERNLLRGRCLDFGCGRGLDAITLGMEKFDPHFYPQVPVGTFDTVLCTYVLNVLPSPTERDAVISDLLRKLSPGGTAYITVRTDRRNLNGWTLRKTWQGYIELDLPVIVTNSSFRIFQLR